MNATSSWPDSFRARVDMSGGPDACWPWTGGRTIDGYGSYHHQTERSRLAHRFALVGPDDDDVRAHHECGNRLCVNPAHIALSRRVDGFPYGQAARAAAEAAWSRPAEWESVPDSWPSRFVAKVKVDAEGCWEWTAACGANGYGRYWLGERETPRYGSAGRYGYQLAYPDRDIEQLVLSRLCGNPGCVRPDHLDPITPQDRTHRSPVTNTELCRAGLHPWVPENIEAPGGRAHHSCRECRRAGWRRVQAKRRSEARSAAGDA